MSPPGNPKPSHSSSPLHRLNRRSLPSLDLDNHRIATIAPLRHAVGTIAPSRIHIPHPCGLDGSRSRTFQRVKPLVIVPLSIETTLPWNGKFATTNGRRRNGRSASDPFPIDRDDRPFSLWNPSIDIRFGETKGLRVIRTFYSLHGSEWKTGARQRHHEPHSTLCVSAYALSKDGYASSLILSLIHI